MANGTEAIPLLTHADTGTVDEFGLRRPVLAGRGDLDDRWEALVPAPLLFDTNYSDLLALGGCPVRLDEQNGSLRRRRTSLGEISFPVPPVLPVRSVVH